eukprot:8160539-Pyramimonas_sp.AAC.1
MPSEVLSPLPVGDNFSSRVHGWVLPGDNQGLMIIKDQGRMLNYLELRGSRANSNHVRTFRHTRFGRARVETN